MADHGKKYTQAAALVDRAQTYPPVEAIDLLKQTSYVSFDASAEAHIRLGVDPRRCAVVGDIGADVEAARAAGARGVLVPTARTRAGEIAAAPERAADLREAVDLLLGAPA